MLEQHAEFIADFMRWADTRNLHVVDVERDAEDAWVETVNVRAGFSLFPRCNCWYLGANVPGKPRVFMPYLGFPDYSVKLREVEANDYEGFATARS